MKARYRKLIAEALGVAPQGLPDAVRIGETEGWDSIGHIRLILMIEKQLRRQLSAEEISSVVDFDTICTLLDSA
ncbi:acyl carrier protein [Rhodovulum imhoffii]|uniref:Acyl carrier protein n=1 Tax=Rhodovulum imhoffii TaxID=365340 RepID=A0A2T5BP65_9RHOB|nr:acyl carrier protein [Rhodovulum imhoffii]MBK5933969.1 hypothetical protein [Rhodovulum imhoffii]PTN00802.1 acyl carrier protein [Rhodovulum imhoffii]